MRARVCVYPCVDVYYLLCVFAFDIIPSLFDKLAHEMAQNIKEKGINTSALFYTDSEATIEAFNHILNSDI